MIYHEGTQITHMVMETQIDALCRTRHVEWEQYRPFLTDHCKKVALTEKEFEAMKRHIIAQDREYKRNHPQPAPAGTEEQARRPGTSRQIWKETEQVLQKRAAMTVGMMKAWK